MKRTFKKAISVFLVVAMLLCAAPLGGFVGLDLPSLFDFRADAASYSGTCGDNLNWSLDTETGLLEITGSGAMYDWSFSSNAPWYSYCGSIKTVNVASGVTHIGSFAFKGCEDLTSVTIPDSVTGIGNNAFINCSAFKDVYYTGDISSWIKISFGTLYSNPLYYGANPYFDCELVTDIVIPDGVETIGNYTFSGCTSLTSITIPEGVTSIGTYAFNNCTNLTSITIPDSVTSIGTYAFYNCMSLTSITIPDGVTSIGSSAFYNCSSLASVTIPDSVTSIGSSAFRDCSSLASVTIPDSVTSISSSAFSGCSNLVLELKKDSYAETYANEENITYYFIYNDTEDKTVSVTVTSKFSFEINKETYTMTVNCSGDMLQFASEDAPWVPYKGYIKHIIINGGCISISANAFNYMYGLKSITIPDSVTSIGNYAFRDCKSLISVTIPDSVTSIASNTFRGCTKLTSVTIPDGVTTIDDNAFRSCTSLMSVIIPDRVTHIGLYAFYTCRSLASITIPDSVTSIKDSAFEGCSGLIELTMPASVSFYSSAFSNCTNIEKITLTKGNGTARDYSSNYQYTPWYISREKCTEVIIEDGVTGIGDYMFYNCVEIGDVTLPISVQSIGSNAFVGCQKLGKLKVYNRNCVFESNATAYYTTIVGYSGSTAEAYANANGFSFESISDNDHEHTYNNSCDNECKICGYVDSDRGHSFDNNCDPACDACGYIRSDIEHKDEDTDGKCDVCEIEISDIQVGVLQNVQVDAGKTVLLKFVPYQSGVYTFTSSSSSDTYGYIYDADQNQLASDDNSGSGDNFSITYTLKKGTVYYLGVKFYNSSSSGEIPVKLTLDQIICDHIRTHTEHKDSTCSQEGYDRVICDDCGDTVSETVIATTDHTYKTLMAEPTCVDEGVVVCLCSVCRYAYIDEILDPLGHSEPVWKTVVKPTTSAEGTMNHVCPACDEVFDSKSIPAITLSGNSTANVNFTTNTISGFDAGSTELGDYLSATNNGYVFTCSSDILYTGAVVELTDGETLINSYTVVIFGDVNGDGWYDGEDAFLVNLIAKGMLSKDDVGEAIWTAADCNHDGAIDEADVDLLSGAGLKLNDVDQSKTAAELATNAEYIEYVMLIDQSAGMHTGIIPEPDTDDAEQGTSTPETNETVDSNEPVTENDIDFEAIFSTILEVFKKIFALVFSFIIK